MELLKRTSSIPLYNTITNIVGDILLRRPNEQFRASEVYLIVQGLHRNRYTVGQVQKGLKWQSESNPDFVKTKLGGFNNKTRIYWYEPVSDI